MDKTEYRLNSQHIPKDFPREFDAHIYFELAEIDVADVLREEIIAQFTNKEVFVGDLIPKPVGPHTLPMFEVNFPRSLFQEVTLWLLHHRKNLNVLVHELTGDDLIDHTQGAMWLGRSVPLKYDVF